MKLFSQTLRPALEEVQDGKLNREVEHTLYAQLSDFEQLQKADSIEGHEQWEIRLPKTPQTAVDGTIRVRRTIPGDPRVEGAEKAAEYVLTTKTQAKVGRNEIPIPTTVDHFEQFKQLAPNGMIKHRYVFEVAGTGLKWEIDMFPRQDDPSQYHDWCKIDLEVKDLTTERPPLPIKVERLIDTPDKRTAEEAAFVRELYASKFFTPNQRLEK